jgi:hypothetical protein
MLREERAGFLKTLNLVDQEVLIYSTDWEENAAADDTAQFKLVHANKYIIKYIQKKV